MPKDKLQHFLAGFSIATLVGLTFLSWKYGVLLGLLVAVIAGALKEYVYDYKMKRGTPEWLDFITTALGGLLSFLIMKGVL